MKNEKGQVEMFLNTLPLYINERLDISDLVKDCGDAQFELVSLVCHSNSGIDARIDELNVSEGIVFTPAMRKYAPIRSMRGHYVTYRKHGGNWFICDDESIKPIKENDFLKKNRNAVMFAYKKCHSNFPSAAKINETSKALSASVEQAASKHKEQKSQETNKRKRVLSQWSYFLQTKSKELDLLSKWKDLDQSEKKLHKNHLNYYRSVFKETYECIQDRTTGKCTHKSDEGKRFWKDYQNFLKSVTSSTK